MSPTLRLLLAVVTLTACADLAAPPGLAETTDAPFAAARSLSSGPTTLPTFGGSSAEARAINDAGTVVGYASATKSSQTTPAVTYAARWVRNSGGAWVVPTRLGAAGGRALALNKRGDAVGKRGGIALVWPAAGGEFTLPNGEVAEGINNARIIVGGTTWDNRGAALVWIPEVGSTSAWTSRPLRPLKGGTFSHAFAINEGGIIAGVAVSAAGREQAVVWLPEGNDWSSPVLLLGAEALAGSSGGFGINAGGDVVGYYNACSGCAFRAYFWPATGGSVDLTTLYRNANSGHARGIEDDQRVVGHFNARNDTSPFLWVGPASTALVDLGTGAANDINNRAAFYGQEAVGTQGGQAIVWRVP